MIKAICNRLLTLKNNQMSKTINLVNVTVENGKTVQTFYKVPLIEGAEFYKNKKIVSVEVLDVLGKTNK